MKERYVVAMRVKSDRFDSICLSKKNYRTKEKANKFIEKTKVWFESFRGENTEVSFDVWNVSNNVAPGFRYYYQSYVE